MENLKPVDLEQKVETRFCAWHKQNKRLFYLDLFFGNYTESIIKVRSYPHSGNSIITLNRNEVLIIPYSDNYVVRDGVLYEKSAYEAGTVGYWLNKMNEPERSLAFENTSPEKLTETITGNESYAIKYALDSAFLWESTAEKGQGWKFWSYVCIEKELAAKTAKELPFFKTSFKDAVLKVV